MENYVNMAPIHRTNIDPKMLERLRRKLDDGDKQVFHAYYRMNKLAYATRIAGLIVIEAVLLYALAVLVIKPPPFSNDMFFTMVNIILVCLFIPPIYFFVLRFLRRHTWYVISDQRILDIRDLPDPLPSNVRQLFIANVQANDIEEPLLGKMSGWWPLHEPYGTHQLDGIGERDKHFASLPGITYCRDIHATVNELWRSQRQFNRN